MRIHSDQGRNLSEDWFREHQEHLQLVYTGARRQLEAVAEQRAWQHPKVVVDILPAGTAVYRKNHAPGRNTIQDIWGSTKYQVVKYLDDISAVYTIRPLEEPRPEQNIHRAELRIIPEARPKSVYDDQEDGNSNYSTALVVTAPPCDNESPVADRTALNRRSPRRFVHHGKGSFSVLLEQLLASIQTLTTFLGQRLDGKRMGLQLTWQ
ncbi:hypothetical protein SKAU_G00060530 [Synaphobranchus kaupii]|uniref:Uncharacterized protein n=1 Tax=Synaphobranchus kaupii TaxID=118154 RepID=A0A9Q1G4P8_SYNKA|nr:hypothetical protein SKAU_G00060530 [Synaphobranchus kaupii]